MSTGGAVLGRYREPLGGTWLVLAAIPLGRIEPTPFQRDLSDAHVKRLENVIDRVGLFLDPVIAVEAPASFKDTVDQVNNSFLVLGALAGLSVLVAAVFLVRQRVFQRALRILLAPDQQDFVHCLPLLV